MSDASSAIRSTAVLAECAAQAPHRGNPRSSRCVCLCWPRTCRGRGRMAAFEKPKRRLPALIPVVVVLLATNAAFGYGYLHYRGIAADQETAIKRIESANADLQDALERIHDRTQRSVQQLGLDNRQLQARLSTLERGLAGLQPGSKPPSTIERPAAPPAPQAAAEPLSPSAIQGALMGPSGPANFIAPGWVPDYFSNESGAMTGTPKRQQRRSHRQESSVRSSWCGTYETG
jgi:hypothetical protein